MLSKTERRPSEGSLPTIPGQMHAPEMQEAGKLGSQGIFGEGWVAEGTSVKHRSWDMVPLWTFVGKLLSPLQEWRVAYRRARRPWFGSRKTPREAA